MRKIKIFTCFLVFLILFCWYQYSFTNSAMGLTTHATAINTEASNQNSSLIRNKINNASNGDTIIVNSGIYNEQIIITKSISLQGEHKQNTVITSNKSSIIIIQNNNVSIQNLTIQGTGNQEQKGIIIQQSTHIEISMNDFTSIHNDSIYLNNSDTNVIRNNTFKENRNGIIIEGDYNQILYNRFINHSKSGIIIKSYSKDNAIASNIFTNNHDFGLKIQKYAKNTTVYLNNFMDKLDANNKGEQTIWYNTTLHLGNYWKRYQGKDENNNGIGDTSFMVKDNNSIHDLFPLMYPLHYQADEAFNPDDPALFSVLTIGVILSIILLIPIAYLWRKYILNK